MPAAFQRPSKAGLRIVFGSDLKSLLSKTGLTSAWIKEKPSYNERWRLIPWPEFRRTPPQGRHCHHTSRESLQSTAPAFSADRVRGAGQEKQRGTLRQRLRLLDPVGLDAILPTRPCRFAARDLQRLGLLPGQNGASRYRQGSQQIHPLVCQRTPARPVV